LSRAFEGWYFKHQKGDAALALIAGKAGDGAFLQVADGERAYHVPFGVKEYYSTGPAQVRLGGNRFGPDGLELNVQTEALTLTGTLRYRNLTPLASDIMGPFRFLPMECCHSVVSMDHDITGTLTLNGKALDFTGGKGYIEGDSGCSFPTSYVWVQCNSFDEPCSVMASAAKIPFCGLKFWGCICAVFYQGREYRLATYRGARILKHSQTELILAQGKYRLEINIQSPAGQPLYAPHKGSMTRVIHESSNCEARFRFTKGESVLFDLTSRHACFEYVQ
jgi:tocopherol cyclase